MLNDLLNSSIDRIRRVGEMSRSLKIGLLLAVDITLCIVATWLAYFLRLGEFVTAQDGLLMPAFVSVCVLLPILFAFGLYKTILRHAGWFVIGLIVRAGFVYALIYGSIVMVMGLAGTPRTVGIIQPLLLVVGLAITRYSAQWWIGYVKTNADEVGSAPIAVVYGAGDAGLQFVGSVEQSKARQRVVGFLDDDPRLHGRILQGIPVYPVSELAKLIQGKGVSSVFLAMPSINKARRSEILRQLAQFSVSIRTLPSLGDLMAGRHSISEVHELEVEDLIDRQLVDPDPRLMAEKVTRKAVLVTGAGGSIGSELCRQILQLRPERLVILDHNEFGLYRIHAELETLVRDDEMNRMTPIVPVLGSVQNRSLLIKIMDRWGIETCYHSAAYKHVPLIEQNIIEGIQNNIFGTLHVVEASIQSGVKDCVLISTDKAVRPTSVMGATKRVAEMILQARHDRLGDQGPCFSMVRFGNVIGSSGSVIPRFREQIQAGGPVTVTHPEVTRYFMSISEAAQLVLQASALAEGGDVFVLDMGEPIKIMDLARRMVRLSGFQVKTDDNQEGAITIEVTGLRPGEKLFEELLIGNNPQSSTHPKILRADESFVPWGDLSEALEGVEQSIASGELSRLFHQLEVLVDEGGSLSALTRPSV